MHVSTVCRDRKAQLACERSGDFTSREAPKENVAMASRITGKQLQHNFAVMNIILHISQGLDIYMDTLNTLSIRLICNMELKYNMRLKEVANASNMATMNAFPEFLEYYWLKRPENLPQSFKPRN